MAKRRTHDSDDYYIETPDDPIGLTGAFGAVRDPQAVEYDKNDRAIGLTEAFPRIASTEPPEWDEENKWKGFDWNADWEGAPSAEDVPAEDAPFEEVPVSVEENAPDEVASDEVAEEPSADYSAEEVVPAVQEPVTPHFKEEARRFDVSRDLAHASAASVPSRAMRRGKHTAQAPEVSEKVLQSHRLRNTLRVVIALLVIALCVLGYFGFRTLTTGQEQADQEAKEQIEAPKENVTRSEGDDTVEMAAQQADVPKLTGLLGKTTDEAIAELARGAFVSSNQKVKDKGSAIKKNLTVALADEPSDSKTGTPSVYLGLDKDDKIIEVGYSAAASALGFGSLSFADAVNNEHVIERTLQKIGVEVEDGVAKLPEDSSKYVTHASDGKTVTKERCSFEGEVDIDGVPCTWSAVLSYDYTTQVITGNLSDTVRIIYVYVTKK
ncbi:MAG: hypothetical protein IJI68_04650 [Eggerthellaceae bacterium]|nr:hypothetical protein [Eggerthellaceae bacterium]